MRELNKRLKGIGNVTVFGVEELDQILPQNNSEEEPQSLSARFQEFRQSIVQTRRVSWFFWAVAILTLLLIVYLVRSSVTQIALWLGWPIAISALAIFIVSYLGQQKKRDPLRIPLFCFVPHCILFRYYCLSTTIITKKPPDLLYTIPDQKAQNEAPHPPCPFNTAFCLPLRHCGSSAVDSPMPTCLANALLLMSLSRSSNSNIMSFLLCAGFLKPRR